MVKKISSREDKLQLDITEGQFGEVVMSNLLRTWHGKINQTYMKQMLQSRWIEKGAPTCVSEIQTLDTWENA